MWMFKKASKKSRSNARQNSMPSPATPNRTPKRRENSTTPSKTNPVDVGEPLGVYDTDSVRDRIRQWQAQGGGVITESGLCEPGDDEEEVHRKSTTPKREDVKKTPRKDAAHEQRGTGTSGKRDGRRKTRIEDEELSSHRSVSAPAKRVVSDGHWRKDRTPRKSTTTSRAAKGNIAKRTPTKAATNDGIRVKAIPEAKIEPRPSRDENRRSQKKETAGGDDGIRVYTTPPGSRRPSVHGRSPQSDNHDHGCGEIGDMEAVSSKSKSPRPDVTQRKRRRAPEKSSQATSLKTREEPHRRTTPEKVRLPSGSPSSAQGEFSEGRGSTRSQKGNILSQVFGFNKAQPVPIATPRVPSIEAWLNETPDPFVDVDEPPLEVIAPLRPSHKLREVAPEEVHAVEDPNKIWETLETKSSPRSGVHGSRRRKRIASSTIYEDNPFPSDFDCGPAPNGSPNGPTTASKFVDIVKDAPELSPSVSPSSLRRRGATKSATSPTRERRKSRSSKEPLIEGDGISSLSSNITTSSVEGPDPKSPLRPPGLNLRRPFPSTGKHRLSTIASVETFNTKNGGAAPSISEMSESTVQPGSIPENDDEAEARDHFDPNSLQRSRSRLTKHADLISVLSLPKAGNKSIVSARSIRTNRSRLATATIGDLMNELATDEAKYMRELRTLVDGVIPVLLTCVLSKNDSSIAAGLFSPSASTHQDPNFTKPIVDMGIALERLKTLHKRIPQQDASSLLTWAQGAQRVYTEYLKAWRMGFQDVVVNLAPAEDGKTETGSQSGTPDLDEGLPRNKDGDVVNVDGERVDVAFLLKRPLVRLKYLGKTLKGINFITPSAEAENLATKYQALVDHARDRSNEERARLEDEAASNIDPTRARDPRTLAPLTGVSIDRTRRVRARDHFNLALQHSSGQRIDCRVEILLRDEAIKTETGGDLLVCEVDGTGRWLLFPPVQHARVSARNGDSKGEIVLMIRGFASNGSEWHELLSLRSEDEGAGFEWVQMLGLIPVPPKISRSQSFISRHRKTKSASDQAASTLEAPATPTTPGKSRTPSPREVEIPIGEAPYGAFKAWTEMSCSDEPYSSPVVTQLRERARLQKKQQQPLPSSPPKPSSNYVDDVSDLRSLPSQSSARQTGPSEILPRPRSFKEALGLAGTSSVTVGLQRSKAKRRSRYGDQSPLSPKSPRAKYHEDGATVSEASTADDLTRGVASSPAGQRSLTPEPTLSSSPSSKKPVPDTGKGAGRPAHHRSRSSVPSLELPFIPKARKNSPPTTPTYEPAEEPNWGPMKESEKPQSSSKLTKKRPVSRDAGLEKSTPPSTPSHRMPSPTQLKGSKTPVLGAKNVTPRRSSSPLKHEYEPSTASDTSSDSETSTVEHNEVMSVTDSSDDEEPEDGDAPTPLMPLGAIPTFKKATPPGSLYSLPNGTLAPSQSASQAPYKTVPPQPAKAAKTIASIFSWSDKGCWEALHPDECSIVITPGLIEAYEMTAAHSKSMPLSSSTPVVDADAFSDLASNMSPENEEHQYDRPLVALELTPLVPLRRGTAIDISIRSPPTANSQITSGSNIMFRSRNPEECEALYALINHSRINNPTYVALQNARASGYPFPSSLDRRGNTRSAPRSSSWFPSLGRSSSYRASSAPTPSIAPSESSIGSMSSAFSALKRFGLGSGGGMFNIGRSTISSREGSRANSIYTSSENSSGSGASSPLPPGSVADTNGSKAAPIGISNAKIRLYIRETASRWRDMGSARLTIMRPNPPVVDGLLQPRPQTRNDEKRIVVNGKTKGEVLLDATLGESCFERVARTGIAISVWEDVKGPNGEVGVVNALGGVGGGRAVVYMVQMKSEAETAYTFSIVGKLRY